MWCGGALTENNDCKHLIFCWLPPFFTIFHHISYHFSDTNNWFLAGYKKMGVYLNRSVFASTKASPDIRNTRDYFLNFRLFQPISAYSRLKKVPGASGFGAASPVATGRVWG
jgi:hypothetical protein